MAEPSSSAEGISITRVFAAPRESVWREWTEPARFADWFGGAEADVPLDQVSMDVREGGDWHATMFFGPSRHQIQWEGRYLEVAEPERLVFTLSDQPDLDAEEVVTVVLADLGDGRTEMRFEQRGGHHPPEGYKRAGQGWSGFFNVMEKHLALS